jgi:hypothetical protein
VLVAPVDDLMRAHAANASEYGLTAEPMVARRSRALFGEIEAGVCYANRRGRDHGGLATSPSAAGRIRVHGQGGRSLYVPQYLREQSQTRCLRR